MQLAAFLALLYLSAALLAMKGYVASSAVSLALFWQQTAFIGHDLGHNAVTQNRELDNLLGLFVNAGVGIGMSWWKSTHNVHHMVVNTADSDPDIQVRCLPSFKLYEPGQPVGVALICQLHLG